MNKKLKLLIRVSVTLLLIVLAFVVGVSNIGLLISIILMGVIILSALQRIEEKLDDIKNSIKKVRG